MASAQHLIELSGSLQYFQIWNINYVFSWYHHFDLNIRISRVDDPMITKIKFFQLFDLD